MRSISRPFFLLCLLGVSLLAGCADLQPRPAFVFSPPSVEFPPAVNLPFSMRQVNWLHRGEGSCAVASLISHINWQNDTARAARIRRTYGGGQTARSLKAICSAERIPFAATESGDVEFLKWASRTRRGAVVWYFTAHAVTFCGFGTKNGDTVAVLLDNNRTKTPLSIPVNEFVTNWRRYGGFALTALGAPAPAPFYERWIPCKTLNVSAPPRYCLGSSSGSALLSSAPCRQVACSSAALIPQAISSRDAIAIATGSSTAIAVIPSTRTTSIVPAGSVRPIVPAGSVRPIARTALVHVIGAASVQQLRFLPIAPRPLSSLVTPCNASGLVMSKSPGKRPQVRSIARNLTKLKPARMVAFDVESLPSAMVGIT
ncbi:hypothetical protein [Allorhodopirellula heiligendammensis]|uniref:Peptidase C39-like domain-containing protein n=1 Tax=Allorhodopirellula heiligendammensis TaxID=2714739 RepID=A0A5C6C4R6_9BACT|nr:hypothetical protein [Allorhodopirellula heiligendammensis]TWU19543.1 hypothetical protein Poly21_17170 [Allorhodopirellula heiligendammensis]